MAVKKKPAAKKPAAKKTAATKAPAKKKVAAAKPAAAKKTTAARKPAAKKPAAKKTVARKTPVKSTEKVRKVKVDNSAEAKAKRKVSRQNYKKNKSGILQARRAWERKLTAKDKMRIAERKVFLRAKNSGKSDAEAKAAVAAYRKKVHGAGGHTAAQERAAQAHHIREQHGKARGQLKALLEKGREGYKRAVAAAMKLKDPKARKQAKAKAAAGFKKLQAQVKKKRDMFTKHKTSELGKIKAANEKERAKKKAAREKAASKPKSKNTRTVAASRVKKDAAKPAAKKTTRKPKAKAEAAKPVAKKTTRKPKAEAAPAKAVKKVSRTARKAAEKAAARGKTTAAKPAAKPAKKTPAKKVAAKPAAEKRTRAKSGSTVKRRRLA